MRIKCSQWKYFDNDYMQVIYNNYINRKRCNRKENGLFDISVKAVVSINKLVEYAQSKGAKTELAGSLFVNNIEIKEKNRENEDIALFNLRKQLMEICKKGLFDYNVVTSEPKFVNDNSYQVQVIVSVCINSNAVNFCEILSCPINLTG